MQSASKIMSGVNLISQSWPHCKVLASIEVFNSSKTSLLHFMFSSNKGKALCKSVSTTQALKKFH